MAKLAVFVIGDASSAKAAMAETGAAAEGMSTKVKKYAGIAGLAIGGALAVGLKDSVDAAMKMQTTTASMDTAFKAAGVNANKYAGQIANLEEKGRNLGFSNIDVRESLGSMVTATQSGPKAFKDLATAEDLARKKHIELGAATKIIASAMAGSTRAARQLGISVAAVHDATQLASAAYMKHKAAITALFPSTSKMTAEQTKQKTAMLAGAAAQYSKIKADAQLKDKQSTAAQVIGVVTQRVKGQAQAFSETAAGGMARFHAQMESLQENLGSALLPAIVAITGKLATMAEWMSKHTTIAKILVIGLGTLAAALMAVSVATTIATAAATAFEIATSPITAIVLAVVVAIGALAFAAYEVYKHWGAISGFFTGIWRAIEAVFSAAVGWLEGHWKIFLGLPGLIWQYWPQITSFFGNLWGDVKQIFSNITGFLSKNVGELGGIATRIGSAMWNGLKAGAVAVTNWIIGKINQIIDAYNAVLGWLTGNIGKLQKIQSGIGAPSGPSGIGGGPVGSAMRAGVPAPGVGSASQYAPRGGMSGASVNVNIGTVHGSADSDFAKKIATELATQLRGGRVPAFQQAIQAI